MCSMRTKHAQQLKTKVALEAIKGQKTTAEITSKYGIHATQINIWKKKAIEIIPDAFLSKRRTEPDQQRLIDELYQQVGRLTVERDWLKRIFPGENHEKSLKSISKLLLANICRH